MNFFLTSTLLLITLNINGQENYDTNGKKIFDQGLIYYNNGKLDSALQIWTEIVNKKIGIHSDTYSYAFFNIPGIYWAMKKFDSAKSWYKRVLDSDLRDSDETGSLMEPHTNFKYKSALALATLYEKDSNFSEVIKWIDMADTTYRYWGYEGSLTNVNKHHAYVLSWKTDILLKLKRKEEAIKVIITELICANNSESFFKESEDILLNIIDSSVFKSDFDAAINKLSLLNIDSNNWVATFTLKGYTYQVPISRIRPNRNLPHYWRIHFIDKTQIIDKKYIIEYIMNRRFYKRLPS